MAHEVILESSFLTGIASFFDYLRGLLLVVKGEEQLVISYLNKFDTQTILRIVEQLQNQIAISVIEHSEERDTQNMIKLSIVLLDLVYQSNRQVNRIDEQMFVNDTCSNSLNLKFIAKQYYKKKSHGFDTGLHSEFVYMDYPWMFSTEAKVEVIQNESNVTMQSHIAGLIQEGIDGSFFGGNLEDHISLNIQVRRNKILEDSMRMLSTQSKNYKKQLKIKFQGEEGVDQGGVKKEFFHLLMKELFNPNYAMFESKFNVDWLSRRTDISGSINCPSNATSTLN